ncbi:hypothetical protein SCP_0404280 [Sparassis crispa]|uniref:Mitochondrial carrier n=1 Tax=Sparassis crispa TaxID=139825 RepID=A0A401GIL8_9APHY|nr:hypothetical protein SCP_0404280 [Sparassis crispa]GBE82050.1 hypothetical protein SCP_0404280 [Sparassis crispa]
MSVTSRDGRQSDQEKPISLYAALARTGTRSLALYFSRPVRLFRPAKVSGWQSLKGLAVHHGQPLTPQYVSWLIKKQGFIVILKHFIPPIIVNGILGTVLWSTYSKTSDILEPYLTSHPTTLAAISGASAGGVQALVAAPAENLRFALEGSSSATGWSDAWKEVFRGTQPSPSMSVRSEAREAREVRIWMKEVGEMAGRGWDGWGWGCAKDTCGFAVFFAMFDLTRRIALSSKIVSQDFLETTRIKFLARRSTRTHAPRAVHGTTLVAGGVVAGLAYEVTCRPWDAARKAVHVHRTAATAESRTVQQILMQKWRDEGLLSYFSNPTLTHYDASLPPFRRRLYSAMRTLARVGPWGVGFLAWEAFGPGIA